MYKGTKIVWKYQGMNILLELLFKRRVSGLLGWIFPKPEVHFREGDKGQFLFQDPLYSFDTDFAFSKLDILMLQKEIIKNDISK